jgi:hypothetical protein
MEIKETNRRGISAFTVFFIFFTTACIFAIIYGLTYFRNYLADYQANLSVTAIDEYFKKLAAGDYSYAIELSGFKEDDFNSEADFITYLDKKFNKKYSNLEYIKTQTEDNTEYYDIYSEDDKKGSIIIEKSGQVSNYGFDKWIIKSVDPLTYIQDITVSVPKGVKIFVNGNILPEKYRTKINIVNDYPATFTGYDRPSVFTYVIKNLLLNPQITAKTSNGDECDKTAVNDNELNFTWPKLKQKELEKLAKEATLNYAYIITQAKDSELFLRYLMKDTPYYKTIAAYNSSWYIQQPEITGDKLENFKISDYFEYDELHISMNVSFDYTIFTANGNKETKFPFSNTIYYVYKDGKWQIVEMVIN